VPARLRILLLAAVFALAAPGGALAAEQTLTFRSAPIKVGPYEVAQGIQGVESPKVDGYVVGMGADVVDAAGNVVPNSDVMLHHVVFAKVLVPDYTCATFRDYGGNLSSIPAERFYAEGEEHMQLSLPTGYGYPNAAQNVWGLLYMLMNHHNRADTVYVRYTVRYVTGEPLTPVRPIWLDVRNCRADPVFNVPGTGGRGSTYAQHYDFRMPESGLLVAGGGHLHGGGLRLELSNRTCGANLFQSLPTWGGAMPMPMLHEPGPTHMSAFSTTAGIPVAAGDILRLNAVYDNSWPHTRVMGIVMVFLAPAPETGCGAMPLLDVDLGQPGPPPHMVMPLPRAPRGPLARDISGTSVGDYRFANERVSIRRGTTFTWRFVGPDRHDVTLVSGPVGFSSPSTQSGRFRFHFTRPGVYNLFCSLHPARMTQTVTVR
jgi:plastocyanin